VVFPGGRRRKGKNKKLPSRIKSQCPRVSPPMGTNPLLPIIPYGIRSPTLTNPLRDPLPYGIYSLAATNPALSNSKNNAFIQYLSCTLAISTYVYMYIPPSRQGSGRCGSATLPASGGELEVFYALITCYKYR